MPLTDKYLKYFPEITLEIFTLIWDKLLSNGYKYEYCKEIIYERFSQNPNRILRKEKNGKNIYPFTDTGGCIETTVQEILGYDPFVKEDFVLPKKWCVKVESNNKPIEIAIWRKTKTDSRWNNPGYLDFSGWHHNEIQKHLTEITFEQFKKYVLKESIKEPKVESKEVIPEYVECMYNNGTLKNDLLIGKIYKVNKKSSTIENIVLEDYPMCGIYKGLSISDSTTISKYTGFKPSTKEAFDAQNKPKSIEKWSIGSYIVPLQNKLLTRSELLTAFKPYIIIKGKTPYIICDNGLEINFCISGCDTEKTEGIKWFATEFEAKEFAKTLINPTKEPKEPLKQAVHCKTQKEWDFVTKKLDRKWKNAKWSDYKEDSKIKLNYHEYGRSYEEYYSFQEWCDLNGYKMENEVKFEVGDYVILRGNGTGNGVWEDELVTQLLDLNNKNTGGGNIDPDFNFKYKNYIFGTKSKHIIRHAAPEEIHNYLISIGQIPTGEPLNTGIEPKKDGVYGCISVNRVGNPQCTFNSIKINGQEILKPKMLLSIDDEELPMVDIIKTNTIKQLLNVE